MLVAGSLAWFSTQASTTVNMHVEASYEATMRVPCESWHIKKLLNCIIQQALLRVAVSHH
jgi:hypothetical protein